MTPDSIDYSRAFWLILAGLFKKVVISSYVSTAIVQPVFTSPSQHSAPEAIFAAWGYAVQIYCDFSGYTDIAIGLAMLLGFRFPQNFDAPYTARNLQDFWRRWHMTLSRWLRDYLYIPLGGNANGDAQTIRNIMITMVLGGLWHGAAWTFVIWGALQGVGQSFGHLRRTSRVRRGLPAVADGPVRVWVQRFLTFQFVCLGWVFFNASGTAQAFAVLGRMLKGWGQASPLVTPLLVIVVVGSIALQFVPTVSVDRLQAAFSRQRAVVQVGLLGFALLGHHHVRSHRRRALHLLPLLMTDQRIPPADLAEEPPEPHPKGPDGATHETPGPGPAGAVGRRTRAAALDAGARPRRGCVRALVPPLRADAPAQRPGVARRHATHRQPRRDRTGRRAQSGAAALPHRVGHGPGEHACPAGRTGSASRGRAPARRG